MLPSQTTTDPAIPRLTVSGLFRDMLKAVRGHAWWLLAAVAALAMAGMDPSPWLGSSVAIDWSHFAYRELVLASVVEGCVALALVARVRNQDLPPLQALVTSLRRLLPLVVATMLVFAICLTGLLLLVVPGLIWMAALTPLVPLIVVERRGVLAGIRESFAMTKGHRLPILVGMLATLALTLLFALALGVGMGVTMVIVDWPGDGLANAVSNGILWSVVQLALAVYSASVYLRLRGLRPR